MNKKYHKELGELFEEKLIRENGGPSIMCDIYDALTDGNEMGENCLGENFNQLVQCIRSDFFQNYNPSNGVSPEFYFGTYIYWLYLIVERFEFVFDVINPDSKSKLIRDFKETNFSAFKEVKDWCIFYKHPREFMFCHWPTYVMDDDVKYIKSVRKEGATIIDTQYVSKNFTKNRKRLPELENNTKVVVVLPELKQLTERYIEDLIQFINFICKNDLVASYLRKKTTVEDYYKEIYEIGKKVEALIETIDFQPSKN